MENVKQHFENEAEEFDAIILRLIPYYEQMLGALIGAIPFGKQQCINVIDLGCGTGTISKKIQDMYPSAKITCVDISAKMLQVAKMKLGDDNSVRYQVGNFEQYEFDSKYDVVISSLALHHLLCDEDKYKFYKKIFASLNPGGVFFNADIVLASNSHLQKFYIDEWVKYMGRQVSKEEIEEKWMRVYYNEDHPAKIYDQLKWLEEIGFVEVDVIWKYYNFGVYGGYKPLA